MSTLAEPLVMSTQMLIRRQAHDVFEAFADPDVTTRFWFTKSTGRLEPGAEVEWTWEMFGATAAVAVKDIQPDRRILMRWGQPATDVEWRFDAREQDTTVVTVTETGYTGTPTEMAAHAMGSTEGFTLVLSAAKALLEHDLELGLVRDSKPDLLRDAS